MNYSITINISEAEVHGPAWRDYGLLKSQGKSLEQLKRNAAVEITDFDGTVLYEEPATAEWMLQLVEQEFYSKYSKPSGGMGGALLHLLPILCLISVGCGSKAEKSQLEILKEYEKKLRIVNEAGLATQRELAWTITQLAILQDNVATLQSNASERDVEFNSRLEALELRCK